MVQLSNFMVYTFSGCGEHEHRLYFRRLSQTTQTDVLLGNLDVSGSGKVMLRSLTVQERIRELNLRARMFTDTMLAIQGSSRLSHPRRVVTKSLQVNISATLKMDAIAREMLTPHENQTTA